MLSGRGVGVVLTGEEKAILKNQGLNSLIMWLKSGGQIQLVSDLSCIIRKPTMWFPTRFDTNQAVQTQKMVKGCKILDLESRGTKLNLILAVSSSPCFQKRPSYFTFEAFDLHWS